MTVCAGVFWMSVLVLLLGWTWMRVVNETFRRGK